MLMGEVVGASFTGVGPVALFLSPGGIYMGPSGLMNGSTMCSRFEGGAVGSVVWGIVTIGELRYDGDCGLVS